MVNPWKLVFTATKLQRKRLERDRRIEEERARLKAIEDYLVGKYSLSRILRLGGNSEGGNRYETLACDQSWTNVLVDLLRTILAGREPTMDVMTNCGDLGKLVLVMDGARIEDSMGDVPQGASWCLVGSLDNETQLSLSEMGRGRGSALSLKLIQDEIREWLTDDRISFLRSRTLV